MIDEFNEFLIPEVLGREGDLNAGVGADLVLGRHAAHGLALERQDKVGDAYDAYRKSAWSEDTASRALTRAAALACRWAGPARARLP